MNYEIIEIINNGNNYMVRVVLDPNNTIFFTFDHIPDQEEVNSAAESYLNSINSFGV